MKTNVKDFKEGDTIRCVALVSPWGGNDPGSGVYYVGDVYTIANGCIKDENWTGDNGIWELVTEKKEETKMYVPNTVSDQSISVFINNKMMVVNSTDPGFNELRDHLKESTHDVNFIEQLVDKREAVIRASDGDVTIEGNVVFYRGQEVHGSISDKLVRMVSEGFSIKPWARFLENVMLNPSENSRQSLYNFLDHFKTPITEDGHFLAFKRVNSDYTDLHSGKFDNSPGEVVEMRRDEVDDDSNKTCSRGLHACASSYLGSFYANSPDARVVVVKIHPRDVVAVPGDYQFSKMRVCRYEVLDDAEEDDIVRLSESEYTDWGQPEPPVVEKEYPNAAVGSSHNGYYIHDGTGDMCQYMHKDGTWQRTCGRKNFWDSEKEAQAHLDRWNTVDVDPMDDYDDHFDDDLNYYYDSYDIYDSY